MLARFDDGLPALVHVRTGRGQMLAWASSLDLSWNDLALKPVFLPFLHQALRTLAGYDPRPDAFTVGQVVTPDPAAAPDRTRVVVAPDGQRTPLETARGEAFELTQPGFYEVRDASSDTTGLLVAANVDLAESDLSALDPAEVGTAVAGTGESGVAAATGTAAPPRDDVTEQSQRLWWYLLLAGMLLLIGETVVAGRFSGGTT